MYEIIEVLDSDLGNYLEDIINLKLKDSDIKELKGLGYKEDGYIKSFFIENHSLRLVCYFDNKLIGIIGVNETETHIYPYFLSNSTFYSNKELKSLFIRFSVQIIKLFKERFKGKDFITYKLVNDKKGYRWLKWLGFEKTTKIKKFVNNYEFYEMKLINKG